MFPASAILFVASPFRLYIRLPRLYRLHPPLFSSPRVSVSFFCCGCSICYRRAARGFCFIRSIRESVFVFDGSGVRSVAVHHGEPAVPACDSVELHAGLLLVFICRSRLVYHRYVLLISSLLFSPGFSLRDHIVVLFLQSPSQDGRSLFLIVRSLRALAVPPPSSSSSSPLHCSAGSHVLCDSCVAIRVFPVSTLEIWASFVVIC